MTNTYTTLNDLFTAIADAIRAKKQSTDVIIADTFPTEIANIRTGFDYVNNEVAFIPDNAFCGCEDLNTVDCSNVTSVGINAFKDCTNLKSVILYDGVTGVGENAFRGCSKATIYCMFDNRPDGWHENWNPDGCEIVWLEPVETWDISATANDNVVAKLYNIQDQYCLAIGGKGSMKNYTYTNSGSSDAVLPPWYNQYTNWCKNISTIRILHGVTNIGDSAFQYCSSLISVTIPDSVTSIGSEVFRNCSSLTSITIPDSVTSIDGFAFSGCSSLISVVYTGTVAQWNTITFVDDWNYGTSNDTTIHCTDGDIAKDGTITYHDN